MFSSTSYPSNNPGSHQSQEHGRLSLSHSHSQPFTVAGMNNTSVTHSPSLRSGSLSGSSNYGMGGALGDSLSQSRSHYQPGYLMVRSNHIFNQTVLTIFLVCNAEPCTFQVLCALFFNLIIRPLRQPPKAREVTKLPLCQQKQKSVAYLLEVLLQILEWTRCFRVLGKYCEVDCLCASR